MVDIVYNPTKQLIILECTRYSSIDELARIIAIMIGIEEVAILNWAEGIAFTYTPLPPTTQDLISELLKGRMYWSDILYAPMPYYRQTTRIGTLDIPVVDVSPNPLLREVAKWLKQR